MKGCHGICMKYNKKVLFRCNCPTSLAEEMVRLPLLTSSEDASFLAVTGPKKIHIRFADVTVCVLCLG